MHTPRLPGAALAAALVATAAAARPAAAQMLALPVVQVPFQGRPLAIAVDAGGGGDGLRTLGAAVALRRGGSRLTGTLGAVIGMDGFGESAPAAALLRRYGFDAESVLGHARALLQAA